MDSEHPDSDSQSQRRFEELSERVTANRADIEALQARAEAANHRADASEVRADASQSRADDDRGRIDNLEARVDVDERMIAELQADGVLSREESAHLKEALRTSRKIGAAIGIVMANRKVSEESAFDALVRASNNTNLKVRIIADEVVRTGDVTNLPTQRT